MEMEKDLFEQLYCNGIYDKAISYSKEHIDVEGVDGYLNMAMEGQQTYRTEIQKLCNDNQSNLNLEYDNVNSFVLKKFLTTLSFITCVVIFFISKNPIFIKFSIIGGIASIITNFICRVKIYKLRTIFEEHKAAVYKAKSNITDKHKRNAANIHETVDMVYLDSLKPEMKEIILMKRELKENQLELQRKIDENKRIMEELHSETKNNSNIQREMMGLLVEEDFYEKKKKQRNLKGKYK